MFRTLARIFTVTTFLSLLTGLLLLGASVDNDHDALRYASVWVFLGCFASLCAMTTYQNLKDLD